MRYILLAVIALALLLLVWRAYAAGYFRTDKSAQYLVAAIKRFGGRPKELPPEYLVAAMELAEQEATAFNAAEIDWERFTLELDRYARAMAAHQNGNKDAATEGDWLDIESHSERSKAWKHRRW